MSKENKIITKLVVTGILVIGLIGAFIGLVIGDNEHEQIAQLAIEKQTLYMQKQNCENRIKVIEKRIGEINYEMGTLYHGTGQSGN